MSILRLSSLCMHKRDKNLKYEMYLLRVKCMNKRTCVMMIGWNWILTDETKKKKKAHIVFCFVILGVRLSFNCRSSIQNDIVRSLSYLMHAYVYMLASLRIEFLSWLVDRKKKNFSFFFFFVVKLLPFQIFEKRTNELTGKYPMLCPIQRKNSVWNMLANISNPIDMSIPLLIKDHYLMKYNLLIMIMTD